MELRHLRYAVAIAEEGSFSRAARRLHVAQQALSQQIADLEGELRVRLFDRTARGVRLTPGGVAFIEAARSTLVQSEGAVARARNAANGDIGRLRVAVARSCRVVEALAIEAVAQFHRCHPNVAIDVAQMPTAMQLTRLRKGTLDVAVGQAAPREGGPLAGELLWEEPQSGVLLPADHPVAKKNPLWLRDLADLPLLVAPRDGRLPLPERTLVALADRGLKPRLAPIRLAGPPELLAASVAQGWGWRLASEPPAGAPDGRNGAVFRRFADPPIPLELWMLWRRTNSSTLVHGFVEICRELRTAAGDIRPGPARPGAANGGVPRASA